MIKEFKTVNRLGEAEIIEKKSRFIATVMPVSSEDEAKQFILDLKKRYYDATHNVFAYQVYEAKKIPGDINELKRYSDDGEPNKTAGLPVLEVFRNEDLRNICVVVTRYFGGTLLGTGGLSRAYAKCARKGIETAGIVTKILYRRTSIVSSYNLSGKIQYEILQNGHILKDTIYTDTVCFDVLVEIDKAAQFTKLMTNITSGSAVIKEGEAVFGKWVDNELLLD